MSRQFQHPETHFNPPKMVKPHFNRPPLREKTIPPHPREVPDKNLRKFMRRMKNRNREAPDLPEYVNQTEWQADFAKLAELESGHGPGHRFADILLEEINILEEDDEKVHEQLKVLQKDDDNTHKELESLIEDVELRDEELAEVKAEEAIIKEDDEKVHEQLKDLQEDDDITHEELNSMIQDVELRDEELAEVKAEEAIIKEELKEVEADDRHVHDVLKRDKQMMEEVKEEALEEGFLNGLATPFAVVGFFTIVYLVYRIYQKIHTVAHELLFVEGGYTKLPKSIDDDDADLHVPGTTVVLECELAEVATHESNDFESFGDNSTHPV